MATAEHLHTYLTPDNKTTGEWFAKLKEKTHFFGEFYATQAVAKALEDWKTHLVHEQSKEMEDLIKCAIAEKSRFMLMHAAERMGITIPDDPLHTPRRNPLHAVNATKHTTDPSPVQRGRQSCPPSQLPRTLEPAVIPPTQCQPPPTEQLDLLKAVKEAIGPVLARLKALEKQMMPPPPPPTTPPPHLALAETSASATCRTKSRPPAHSAAPAAADPTAPCPTPPAGEGWSTAARKNTKGKKKVGQTSGIQGAIHLVPGSFTYAAVAQQAANLPTAPPSKPGTLRTQTH